MTLTSAPPLEPLLHKVGHLSTLVIDDQRDNRMLGVELWYPAQSDAAPITEYELIPGISFESASAHENSPVLDGRHPLIIWSHGRTGTRHNYSLLCEALASRGYIVVSSDHPGDGLFDWLLGKNVDDVTNERQRQGDIRFCIDMCAGERAPLVQWLEQSIDTKKIIVGGHSYGGLSALATTSYLHEFAPDVRVCATVAAQGYTKTMSSQFFQSITKPTLLIVGTKDLSTPAITDADPAWAVLQSRTDETAKKSRRVDIDDAPHQGCSDFCLYNELAPGVDSLPDLVRDYLQLIATETPPEWIAKWREGLRLHVQVIDEFLSSLF